jgi:hypothetical protein
MTFFTSAAVSMIFAAALSHSQPAAAQTVLITGANTGMYELRKWTSRARTRLTPSRQN